MANDLNRSIKIYIDNSDAMKKASDFTTKIEKLESALEKLDSQGKKNSPEYKRKEKDLKALRETLSRYEDKVKDTERVLRNLSGATKGELLKVQKELMKSLKNTSRDTDEYKAKLEALKAVKKELAIVNKEERLEMGKQSTMFSRMADGFNKYFGIITSVIAGVTGVSFTLRKLSQDAAEMDDVYSDVMKTTGNTRDQVLELNEVFKAMDTRTSREQLNMLARDAGKLSISTKEDILEFVEGANQIDVALGEDLGDTAIREIGKITDAYARSTKEFEKLGLRDKMLSVGSAINELGATSTANEQYLVSFAGRLGGIASQAGLSLQNVMGFASALDQNMQAVEMSATAFQKLIMSMLSDVELFAKIAGMSMQDFQHLLETDINQAILLILKNLGDKGGLQQLIPIFKDMGLDAARAAQVISSLASNVEKIGDAQKVANEAFAENISLTNEYNIKNNNAQAQLEKQKKAFKDAALELGERLNPALLQSTKWTTYFIKSLPTLLDFLEKYGKYILYIAGAYAVYFVRLKAYNAYQKISTALLTANRLALIANAAAQALNEGNTLRAAAAQRIYDATLMKSSITTKAYTAATTLLASAKALLTGNVSQATTMFGNFFRIIKVNPYIALLAAIPLVFKGISSINNALRGNSDEIERLKKKMNEAKEATEQYNNEIAKEQTNLTGLLKAISDTSEGEKVRLSMIKDLTKEYPSIIKYIDTERVTNEQLLAVLRLVNAEYDKRFEISAYKGLIDAESKEVEEAKKRQILVSKILRLIGEGYKENSTVVKEHLKTLNEGNGWLKNDIDTAAELRDEYSRLDGVISKSMTNITEYKKDMSAVESDISKMNNYESVVELLNLKANEMLEMRNTLERAEANDYSEGFIQRRKEDLAKLEADYDILYNKAEALKKDLNPNTDNTTGTPTIKGSDDGKGKNHEKKAVDKAFEELETKHQERLAATRTAFRNGDIKTEAEYNRKLFAEEQAYYLLREEKLQDFIDTVKDKELKSDLQKQLAESQNKRLDQEIKYQKELEKILLNADPEEKERRAYEERLAAVGIFLDKELELTGDKKKAFELLEAEHLQNMKKIREQGEAMAKADSETKFEELFADTRERMQEELNELTVNAASLNGNSFDAEMAVHLKRLEMINAEIKARKQAGLDITKQIKAQGVEETKMTALVNKELQLRANQFKQYGQAVGTALGNVMIGQEDALRSFGDTSIDIVFDVLANIIEAELIKIMASSTSAIMRSTAEAMATPQSALSFGSAGYATAAILTGAIVAATAVAKAALKGLLGKRSGKSSSSSGSSGGGGSSSSGSIKVKQRKEGNYSVIGADDKRQYNNVPFTGLAKTGVVTRPTLVAETGAELIVSPPDLAALQRHVNYPVVLQALQDARNGNVPQRAEGNYKNIDNTDNQPMFIGERETMDRLVQVLEQLQNKDFTPYLGISELQARLNKANKEQKNFSQSK